MYKFRCGNPDENYLFGIHLDSDDVFSEGQKKLSKQADLNCNSSNSPLELGGPVVITTEKIKNDAPVYFVDQNELNDSSSSNKQNCNVNQTLTELYTPHLPVHSHIHPVFPPQNSNWNIRNIEIDQKKKSNSRIFNICSNKESKLTKDTLGVDFSLKLEDPRGVPAPNYIVKQNLTLEEHNKEDKTQLLFPRCKLNKPPLSKSDLQELFSLTSYSSENSQTLVNENLVKPIKLKAKLCTKLEEPHKVSKLNALKPKQTAKVIERVVKEQDSLFGNLLSSIDEQIMAKDQKKNKNKEVKISKDVTKDNKSDKTKKDIELKHKTVDILVVNKNDSCKEKKDMKSNHHIKYMSKYSEHSTRHKEYKNDFKNKEHKSKSKDLTKIKDSDSKNKYDSKSKDKEIKSTDKESILKSKVLKHKDNKPKNNDKNKTSVKSTKYYSNIKKSISKHNEYKGKKNASNNSKNKLEKSTEINKVNNFRRPLSTLLLKIDDKKFEQIPFENNIYNHNNLFTPNRDQFRTYQLIDNQDQFRIRQDHFRPKKDRFRDQRPGSDQFEQNQDHFRRNKTEIDKKNDHRRYEEKNTPENKRPSQNGVKCKHHGKWRFKEKVKNPNIELKEDIFSHLNRLHTTNNKPIVRKGYDIQDEVEESKSVEENKIEETVEEAKRAQNECEQNNDKETEVKTDPSTPNEETGIPKIEAAFSDEKLNMFHKFMKHIVDTCDSSFLLQFLEKCGISFSQSRNKRVRRIIYSDSESGEEITKEKENKQEEKVKGEETSRAKESEQQTSDKLQDEENLIVTETLRNPKRKHIMYSSDFSSEKLSGINGESLVKEKIVTTKSMKKNPRKRRNPLELSQDNLRSEDRMCKMINIHEEHELCDVLNNSKNKEKDYGISADDDVPLAKRKIVKNCKRDSVTSEENNLPQDDLRSGDRMCRILKEHEEKELSNVLIQFKNKENDYIISDDDLPLAKRKTLKSPKKNLKQQETLKNKKKKEDIREITTEKNKILQKRLRSSRVFLEVINFSTVSSDEGNLGDEKGKKKKTTFVEPEVSLGVKPEKKRRGRPRKIFDKPSVSLSEIESDFGVKPKKRKRGRPRKIFEKSSVSLSKIESETTKNETIEFETVKCAEILEKKKLFKTRMKYRANRILKRYREMNKVDTLSLSQSTEISSQLPITGSVNEHMEVEAKLPQLPQSQISDDNEYALFKVDLKPDIHYFLDNRKRFHCRLCNYKGKFIVHHYRTRHPESENLISRLNPDEAEKAQIESKLNKFEEVKPFEEKEYGKKLKTVFVCRFCNISLRTIVSTFVDHICCHTGEYRYSCKLCPFFAKNKITLSNHCYNFHPDLKKPLRLTPIWPSPPNFRIMFGYLCKACNFTQILKKNVENHINVSHLGQNIEIIKISMSSQSVTLDDINTTKNIETKLDEIEKSRENTPDMTVFVRPNDTFSDVISEQSALKSIMCKVENEITSINIDNHPIEAIHSEEISNLMKELFPPQDISLKNCNTMGLAKTEPNNEENEDVSREKDTIKISRNCSLAGSESSKTENKVLQMNFEDEISELPNEEDEMQRSEKKMDTSNVEHISTDSTQDFGLKYCSIMSRAKTEPNNEENEDSSPEKNTIIANICSLAGTESPKTENEDSQKSFEDDETTELPNEEEEMHRSEKEVGISKVEHIISTDSTQDIGLKNCNTICLAKTEPNNEDTSSQKDTIRFADIFSLAGMESSETENGDSKMSFEDDETTELLNEEEEMHRSEKEVDTSNVEHTISTDSTQDVGLKNCSTMSVAKTESNNEENEDTSSEKDTIRIANIYSLAGMESSETGNEDSQMNFEDDKTTELLNEEEEIQRSVEEVDTSNVEYTISTNSTQDFVLKYCSTMSLAKTEPNEENADTSPEKGTIRITYICILAGMESSETVNEYSQINVEDDESTELLNEEEMQRSEKEVDTSNVEYTISTDSTQDFALKCSTMSRAKTEPNNEENGDTSPERDTIIIANICSLEGMESSETENSQMSFENDETTELPNEEEEMQRSEKEVNTSNVEHIIFINSKQDFGLKNCITMCLAKTEPNNEENEDTLSEKDTIRIANIFSIAGMESSETEEDPKMSFEDDETTELLIEEEEMHRSKKEVDTSNIERAISSDSTQDFIFKICNTIILAETEPNNDENEDISPQKDMIRITNLCSLPGLGNEAEMMDGSEKDMGISKVEHTISTYTNQNIIHDTIQRLAHLQTFQIPENNDYHSVIPQFEQMETKEEQKESKNIEKNMSSEISSLQEISELTVENLGQGKPEIEKVCYKINEEHEAAISLSQDNINEVTSPVPYQTFDITPPKEIIDDNNIQIYYKCVRCPKKSNELDEIRSHFSENHSRENAVSFKYKKVTMDKSKKLHYKCNYCEWFADPESLKQHCSIIHNDKIWVPQRNTKLKCIICAQMFSQLNSIKKHFSVQHPNEDLSFYTLLEDGMVLDKTEFLKEKQILIICNYCGDQFDNKTELFNHHTLSHSHLQFKESADILNKEEQVLKIFKCPECEHSSNSYNAIRQHLMNHVGKPVRCCYCNACFHYPSNLKNHHVRKHRDLLLIINKVPEFSKQMEKITGAMLHLNKDGTYSTKNKLKRSKSSRELNEPPTKILVLNKK